MIEYDLLLPENGKLASSGMNNQFLLDSQFKSILNQIRFLQGLKDRITQLVLVEAFIGIGFDADMNRSRHVREVGYGLPGFEELIPVGRKLNRYPPVNLRASSKITGTSKLLGIEILWPIGKIRF